MNKLVAAVVAFVVGSLLGLMFILTPIIGVSHIKNSAAVMPPLPPTYCIGGGGTLPETVPEPFNSIFTEAANHYDVPPQVLGAVYFIENWTGDGTWREPPPPYGSGWAWPSSPVGASGPFQFMPGTWLMYGRSGPSGNVGNINDLTDSAYAAAHYLAVLGATSDAPLGDWSDRYQKPSVVNALTRYNAGELPGNWVNPETNDYLQKAEAFLRPYYDGTVVPRDTDDDDDSDDATDPCDVYPYTPEDGFPNTDHLECEVGEDRGVAQTAKGNKIRLCRLSNGLVVNASIATQYQSVISQMSDLGYSLYVTDGFRTLSDQLDRRRVNCGPTHYDLWEKPNLECSPPTAIPGESRHEQGLAGDFGGFLYHNQQFEDMNDIAPKLGICNYYPVEPWHWDDVNC